MMEKKSAMDIFMEQATVPEEECEEICETEYDDEPLVQQQQNLNPATLVSGMAAKSKAGGMPKTPPSPKKKAIVFHNIKTSEQLQLEKESIQVRETGFWFWRRIIVPPNAYVIHTRIHRRKPVTIGLGLSFKYNPNKDAYQVIPASMQTIGVVANCISKEKQGINILAYLQWQIEDIAIAYRKLDFSDRRDPLAIVNAQLREQAEAAIKDKIATMSVEEVLTDKAPIIQELTTRLKAVTEERDKDNEKYEGLGIKIITVQIREAIVCSQSLWKNLQSPFRYEKTKTARLSYLETQEEIRRKELETEKQTQTNEAETRVEIESIRQKKETEAIELKLKEDESRFKKQQETKQNKLQLEEKTALTEIESRERIQARENALKLEKELEIIRNEEKKAVEEAKIRQEAERRRVTLDADRQVHQVEEETRLKLSQLENTARQLAEEKTVREQEAEFNRLQQQQQDALEKLVLDGRLAREKLQQEFQLDLAEKKQQLEGRLEEHKVRIERMHQEIRNLINDKELFNKFIKELPGIAAALPSADELKIIQTGEGNQGIDALANFITRIFSVAEMLGIRLPRPVTEKQAGDVKKE